MRSPTTRWIEAQILSNTMKILGEIKRNGFVELKAPISDMVAKAMIDFKKFLNLEVSERKQWTFDVDRVLNPQIGYVPREGAVNPMTGHPYDFKDVFHYDPSLPGRATERGLNVSDWREWLDILERLYGEEEMLCRQALKELEMENPKLHAEGRVRKIGNTHVLRLLHYHMKVGDTGVLGRGHIDEWLFTVNLGENAPGLKVGEPGNTHFIKRGTDTVILYPGRKAERLTDGALKALYHEIVGAQPNQNSDDRFAVTFFFDIDDQPA